MKIYIVRHGETKLNSQGRILGWTDDLLNDMGILLARETGKAMKEMGLTFDAVFSSPLSRARQTAEIILSEMDLDTEIQFDTRIMEMDMGDFDCKSADPEKHELDPAFVECFQRRPLELPAFPNGESFRDVMARTQEFLRELAGKSYESVLVTTHGCALRCMLNFLYENPDNFWQGHAPYNCCVNVVEAIDGELSLIERDLVLYDKKLCVDRYKVR